MPQTYVHEERVRFGDLDAMRHLNNVVYLRYFETARIAFMRELHPQHEPAHPETSGTGMIFAECHIRYLSPVQFDELVEIECSIGEVRRSAFEMRFAMRVRERQVAEGNGWLVGFDYAEQRSAPLPEPLRGVLLGASVAA